MREERRILIEGISYSVVISDEKEALLAAKAAGRALIGFLSREGLDLSPASYVTESLEGLDDHYLEQVVRRTYGLPWKIAESRRLFIREFQLGDEEKIPREETDKEADKIFYTKDRLFEYIRCQYGFYEYGIWALAEKTTGELVGKAGIIHAACYGELWDTIQSSSQTVQEGLCLELGYHIFKPYRHKGYAKEACQAILKLIETHAEKPYWVYAKIDASNEASIGIALSCGLRFINQKYTEEGRWLCLYAGCWK